MNLTKDIAQLPDSLAQIAWIINGRLSNLLSTFEQGHGEDEKSFSEQRGWDLHYYFASGETPLVSYPDNDNFTVIKDYFGVLQILSDVNYLKDHAYNYRNLFDENLRKLVTVLNWHLANKLTHQEEILKILEVVSEILAEPTKMLEG